jgi:hypothetical protein
MLRSRAFRYVALIAGAVTSVSCGDVTGSTSPTTAGHLRLSPPTKTVAASFVLLSGNERARAVRWGAYHQRAEQRVSAVVGSVGGTLSLPGSDFTMHIPRGALSEPTSITVTSIAGPHVVYDMQPHGLRFLRPVTVVQELRNTASYGTPVGDAVRSAYLSDNNDQIAADDSATPAELEAAVTLFYGAQPVAETHVWYLHHFSRWILISGVWTLVKE